MILLFAFDDRFPDLLLHFFLHSASSQHKIAINLYEQCEKNTWVFKFFNIVQCFLTFVTPIFRLKITIYNSIESLVLIVIIFAVMLSANVNEYF